MFHLFFLRRSLTEFQWVPCTVHGTHKPFIKNGFHGTIYIFKNYFATLFSVFSKISGIQTDP